MTQSAPDYHDDDLPPDPEAADGGGDERTTSETALLPPHDLDAEAAVLSACILDPPRLSEIVFLEPSHMYSGAHKRLMEAIIDLRSKDALIDPVTVASWLKDRHRLAEVGGTGYIASILDAAPVVANLRAYAINVYERWRLREMILVGSSVAARGLGPVPNVQEFAEGAVRSFANLARNSPTSPEEPPWMIFRRIAAQMAEAAKLGATSLGRIPGMPTGIQTLDQSTLGMKPGEKWTVMAQRGRGKSSFMLQVCMYASGFRHRREPLASRRVRTRIFSTEMTRDELGIKMLALASRVDSVRLERQLADPTLSQEEWNRVGEALPVLERLPIIIDDRSDLTADDIAGLVRQDVAQAPTVDRLPLGLVAVDYIQRLPFPKHMMGGKKREDEMIMHGSKTLKELAKSEQIAVLELAQMNAPDAKVSKTGKPYEGLAANCKGIEKESNVVLCLWRKKRDNNVDYGLTCTKMRGGNETALDMEIEFEAEYSSFLDPAYKGFRSAFEDFT